MKALITGANSLVNRALLERLVKLKYEVVAHYHRDNDITAELKKAHPKVTFVQADFADLKSVADFLKQATSHGPYEVIINAATYYAEKTGWQPQLDWEEWQRTFAINTTAYGMVLARADQLMKQGVIINISSIAARPYMAELQFSMYGASKAAVDSLTMAYAKRWSPAIRVAGIAPGWVRSAWNINMPAAVMRKRIKPQLTQKWVEPEEIADLAEAVIKNGSINATTLHIDGGLGAPIVN